MVISGFNSLTITPMILEKLTFKLWSNGHLLDSKQDIHFIKYNMKV